MDGLQIYILRIESETALENAFREAIEAEGVESCLVEPDRLQLRFLAPRARADALLERIYLEGSLVWCSRHLVSTDVADV